MEEYIKVSELQDFIGYCESHSWDGKVSASSVNAWLESKKPKDYGNPIFEGEEIVAFERKDNKVIIRIGDLVKTSAFGTRMSGTVKKIRADGLITFKNIYPDGNDVDRWVKDVDHFNEAVFGTDVFTWLKS